MNMLVSLPEQDFELDWVAYFEEFCRIHGGEPVEHEGRLLFRDGWTHSKSDHAGPEWAPDPARVTELGRVYWAKRRKILEDERRQLKELIDWLRQTQARRSAPLQYRTMRYGDDGPQYVSEPVDLAALEDRLELLTQDLAECEEVAHAS